MLISMRKRTIIKLQSCWLYKMVYQIVKLKSQVFPKIIVTRFRHTGKYEVVDELLRNGAEINVPDDAEKTLLDVAMQQSNN